MALTEYTAQGPYFELLIQTTSAERQARTVVEREDALILDFELQRISELGRVVQHIHGRDEHRARHQHCPMWF